MKNCDATLRRVMLSPLLPAMAAVQYSLEKKQTGEALWVGQTFIPLSAKGSTLFSSLSVPVGSSEGPPYFKVCLGL